MSDNGAIRIISSPSRTAHIVSPAIGNSYTALTDIPAAVDAIDGLTPAADKVAYYTGASAAALTGLTSAGRALIDDADAAAQRTTLGLGTSATYNIGTSGGTIPLLNGANTWSSNTQVWQGTATFNDAAGINRGIHFKTGDVNRWFMYASSDAETGANAGTNFNLLNYDDAGAYLSTVLAISRATGNTNLKSLTLTTDLAIADGGTGASTAGAALSNLGGQPLDSDLTAIAALSPANDDFIQRKAGAWSARTIAQVKTDLGLFRTLSPLDYGAVGDGVTSDTTAINAMFAALRASIDSTTQSTKFRIDFSGGRYLIDGNGIDASNIRTARSVVIDGGSFIGKCTGKHVFDLAGSRFFSFNNVQCYGDTTSIPSSAVLLARLSTNTSADCHVFNDCHFDGYYSIATLINYASETIQYDHCRFWNSNPDAAAYCVILQGINAIAVTSQFQTLATGALSFMGNMFISADIRRSGPNTLTITGISNSAPGGQAVITYTGIDPANTDEYWIDNNVGGMTEMRNRKVAVANVNAVANTFEASGVDSSAYGVYTSGGTAYRESGAAIFVDKTEQLKFINSYAVAYSTHVVAVRNGGAAGEQSAMLDFDMHMEGVHDYSFSFLVNAGSRTIRKFSYQDNNPHAIKGLFTTDATVETVSIQNLSTIIQTSLNAFTVGMFSVPARFALPNVFLQTTESSRMPTVPGTFASFRGITVTYDRTPGIMPYYEERVVTDTTGTVTANEFVAMITSQSLTTAAGATATITVNCTNIVATDMVLITRQGGTNSAGTPEIFATPGAGSYVISIRNNHASVAFNGTFILGCEVKKFGA